MKFIKVRIKLLLYLSFIAWDRSVGFEFEDFLFPYIKSKIFRWNKISIIRIFHIIERYASNYIPRDKLQFFYILHVSNTYVLIVFLLPIVLTEHFLGKYFLAVFHITRWLSLMLQMFVIAKITDSTLLASTSKFHTFAF